MKKLFLIMFCVFCLLFSSSYAEEELVIEEIEPDTIASSSKMNERFKAIEDIINLQLVTMWDYGAPVGTKTFQHTASPTTIASIVTEPGIETIYYSDGSKIAHLTKDSPEGTLMTGRKIYNIDGSLYQDLTYEPSVLGIDITGVKTIGKVWSSEYIAKKPDGSVYSVEANMYSITDIQTITVPAGTFECVKVFVTTQNYKYTSWLAEGVGLVQKIGWIGPGGNHGIMKLE